MKTYRVFNTQAGLDSLPPRLRGAVVARLRGNSLPRQKVLWVTEVPLSADAHATSVVVGRHWGHKGESRVYRQNNGGVHSYSAWGPTIALTSVHGRRPFRTGRQAHAELLALVLAGPVVDPTTYRWRLRQMVRPGD